MRLFGKKPQRRELNMNETPGLEDFLLNESPQVDPSSPPTVTKNPPFWKRLRNKCGRRGKRGTGCGGDQRDVEVTMNDAPGLEDVVLNEPPQVDQSSPQTMTNIPSFWKRLKNKCRRRKKKRKVCGVVGHNVEVQHQMSNAFEEENVESQTPEGLFEEENVEPQTPEGLFEEENVEPQTPEELFEEENVEPQVINGSFEEEIVEPKRTKGSFKEELLTDVKVKAFLDSHRHVLFEYFHCHHSVLCGYVHEKVPIEVLKSWLAAKKGSFTNVCAVPRIDIRRASRLLALVSGRQTLSITKRSSLIHGEGDEDAVCLNSTESSLSQSKDESADHEECESNEDKPVVIGNWEIISKIGEGGCGVVYKAKNVNSEEEVIVKEAIYVKGVKELRKEAEMMKSLNHKNIRKLIDVHESPAFNRVLLILEYVNGASLYSQLAVWGKLEESQAWHIMEQLASAFAYLHSLNIVHRDIKLLNVLYSRGLVKVIDFGSSQSFIHGEKVRGYFGTPGYMAPEISKNGCEGPPIDVWALGILYTTLFVGLHFDGRNIVEMSPDKSDYNVVYSPPPFASEALVSLLTGMLRKDPLERLTMQEIVNHPWFEENRQMLY